MAARLYDQRQCLWWKEDHHAGMGFELFCSTTVQLAAFSMSATFGTHLRKINEFLSAAKENLVRLLFLIHAVELAVYWPQHGLHTPISSSKFLDSPGFL